MKFKLSLYLLSFFLRLENYGFRGEALASISQVADVIITTKKKTDAIGAQAVYKDGKMLSCKNIAANNGTVIMIENLFDNFKERKSNLMVAFNKEYNKIIEVIQCYAIHCNFCSFHLEKELRPDVISKVDESKIELVKSILGRKVANNLLEIKHSNLRLDYTFDGLISNTNATLNRYLFILFINNRLVDCSSLKTTIKEIFSDQLMKGSNPFVYLNLSILQKNLDVNLHPSKREVRYLNEDLINKEIGDRITQCLIDKGENQDILKINTSLTQKLNKSMNFNNSLPTTANNLKNSTSKTSRLIFAQSTSADLSAKKSKPAYKKIHDDGSSRKVTDMFAIKMMSDRSSLREIKLTSIKQLREEVDKKKDLILTNFLRKITLVGILDHRRLLIQYEELMNMLDFIAFRLVIYFKVKCLIILKIIPFTLCLFSPFSKAFFYQYFFKNFGNFKTIDFKEQLHLYDLLEIFKVQNGINDRFNIEENTISLIENRELYDDYFSMKITKDGFLRTIPIVVDGYKPNLNLLPLLIWNLTSVIYEDEQKCFKLIGEAFADFYSRPLKNLEEQKQNVKMIFSRFKEETKPESELKSAIMTIGDLKNLYRIFERC